MVGYKGHMKRLWIIDTSYAFWRAYHTPSRNLNVGCSCVKEYHEPVSSCPNCEGTGYVPTKAVYHFTKNLIAFARDHRPDRIAFVFDGPRASLHRKQIYPAYKENRKEELEGVKPQKRFCRRIIKLLDLCRIHCEGYEADDAIATLAVQWAAKEGRQAVIYSRDKDMMALLGNPRILQFDPLEGKWFNADAVKRKFGIGPEQVPDYLSLLGDAADNIPGVKGWGEKKSSQYLGIYKTLDRLLEAARAGSLPGHLSKTLVGADEAGTLAITRKLIALRLDVPLHVRSVDFRAGLPLNLRRIRPLTDFLGFRSL